jgi:protein O-GlcNAc transferase
MHDPSKLFHQALQLHSSGSIQAAESLYSEILKARSDHFDALHMLGVLRYQQGRLPEAFSLIGAALKAKPGFPPALLNFGLVLEALQRREEALAAYDKALAVKPDYADALCNRGNVLQELSRPAEALASFDRALTIAPNDADTLNNRGNALRDLRRPAEALASYQKALAIEPDHRYAFDGLADTALVICDWRRTRALAGQMTTRLRHGRSSINPFRFLAYGSEPSLQLEAARKFVAREIAVPAPPQRGAVRNHDKLRIAYLSSDFRNHPVGHLTVGLYEIHDRRRFEIMGISYAPDDGSEIRARLGKAFDRFYDASVKSDQEVTRLLRDLQVDIAIDLNGHTQGNRLGILAPHPAPVQVSYLGYPGTTGADFLDYVIADPTILPFDQQRWYSEKIVHLPDCYLVYDSKRCPVTAAAPTRGEAGLPHDRFVFCCFNQSYKITAPIFDVWMRLLGANGGSVLWLSHANDAASANLRREAQARGIDPNRLIFAARLPRFEDHLARHGLADLFLDTLPYNAHTTAGDALSMGVPLVTCQGTTFAGRVASSLLHAVGLPELITGSLGEYEALALRLAADGAFLRGLRDRLEQNRSTCPLFDMDRFRRHIESAYITMWEIQQRGSPRSFRVDSDEAPGR